MTYSSSKDRLSSALKDINLDLHLNSGSNMDDNQHFFNIYRNNDNGDGETPVTLSSCGNYWDDTPEYDYKQWYESTSHGNDKVNISFDNINNQFTLKYYDNGLKCDNSIRWNLSDNNTFSTINWNINNKYDDWSSCNINCPKSSCCKNDCLSNYCENDCSKSNFSKDSDKDENDENKHNNIDDYPFTFINLDKEKEKYTPTFTLPSDIKWEIVDNKNYLSDEPITWSMAQYSSPDQSKVDNKNEDKDITNLLFKNSFSQDSFTQDLFLNKSFLNDPFLNDSLSNGSSIYQCEVGNSPYSCEASDIIFKNDASNLKTFTNSTTSTTTTSINFGKSAWNLSEPITLDSDIFVNSNSWHFEPQSTYHFKINDTHHYDKDSIYTNTDINANSYLPFIDMNSLSKTLPNTSTESTSLTGTESITSSFGTNIHVNDKWTFNADQFNSWNNEYQPITFTATKTSISGTDNIFNTVLTKDTLTFNLSDTNDLTDATIFTTKDTPKNIDEKDDETIDKDTTDKDTSSNNNKSNKEVPLFSFDVEYPYNYGTHFSRNLNNDLNIMHDYFKSHMGNDLQCNFSLKDLDKEMENTYDFSLIDKSFKEQEKEDRND